MNPNESQIEPTQGDWSSSPDVERAEPVSVGDHWMGLSLWKYTSSKVHPQLWQSEVSRVIVQAPYMREAPATSSHSEKIDKPFNWQRPTITFLDSETVQVNCPPGEDYIRHYAALLATYFKIEKRKTEVLFKIPSPLEQSELFENSNLTELGRIDIAILGYVEQMGVGDNWDSPPCNGAQLFAWHKEERYDGRVIAYLGCRVSFWGDMSGKLVHALHKICQVKCILYIGKAGTLSPNFEPNQYLVTGDSSVLDGHQITWNNVLKASAWRSIRTRCGAHVTAPSPLCESRDWVNNWREQCMWVDCEVGHMAHASNNCGIGFGYLHIVSDNAALEHDEDLTNERSASVLSQRERLFSDIREIVKDFCSTWR